MFIPSVLLNWGLGPSKSVRIYEIQSFYADLFQATSSTFPDFWSLCPFKLMKRGKKCHHHIIYRGVSLLGKHNLYQENIICTTFISFH